MAKETWLEVGKRLNLPAFQEESTWQEKIDEEKQSYVGLDTAELARTFARARNLKKEYEEQVKGCVLQMEALSQLLIQDLEDQDIRSITLSTGETVYLQAEPYPATTDRGLLRGWIMDTGQVEVLTVNYQTLVGITKERLLNGLEPPPGVEVFLKMKARCRGGSSAESEG